MHCTSQVILNSRQTTKRNVAFAFLICFIVVSFLSAAFILTHVDHDHDHDGAGGSCATCTQIQNAENLLKQFCMAAGGSSLAFMVVFSPIAVLYSVLSLIGFQTLVNLKIRMNN